LGRGGLSQRRTRGLSQREREKGGKGRERAGAQTEEREKGGKGRELRGEAMVT
jgi:hypothetical protein